MALMTKLIESESSSFEEAISQPLWVDAIVEEYSFIMQNGVCEIVLK